VKEAGRDRRFSRVPEAAPSPVCEPGPHFLLLSPRNPANCGLAARAIKNFGFRSLWLVALPTENGKDYFGDHARGTAWRAWDVLLGARVPGTLGEARSGLRRLVAVDPEPPEGLPVVRLEDAAALACDDPEGTGFLFGRESSGLASEEIYWATHALPLPAAPEYRDLNVAQAVLLVAAEIRRERLRRGGESPPVPQDLEEVATLGEIQRLVLRASSWLLEIGFAQPTFWRPARGLLRLLLRARPRRHEISLLLGVVDRARKRRGSARRMRR
jgi:tRNA/rRNA methyltransferase